MVREVRAGLVLLFYLAVPKSSISLDKLMSYFGKLIFCCWKHLLFSQETTFHCETSSNIFLVC